MAKLNGSETESLLSDSGRSRSMIDDTRSDYQKSRAIYFVLVCTLFERIAFYALVNTLFSTLRWYDPFNWKDVHSQTASFIFSGISYISTLIFAIINDAKLNRARTIIIGFVVYLVGYTMVTITMSGQTFICRFDDIVSQNVTSISTEKCAVPILGTLICTAIGAGAVKSNMAVFGAEQIQESKISARYFHKYAFIVNFGSMVAILVLPYIQNKITADYYFIPYLVATGILLIAVVLFILGYRCQYYIHINSNKTVITKCIPVTINALQSWYKNKGKRPVPEEMRNPPQLQEWKDFDFSTGVVLPKMTQKRPSSFLDFAKEAYGGRFDEGIVNDVKTLRRALIVFTLLVPYWVIYNQTTATFSFQGEHMKRPPNSDYIVSWMSLGDPVLVMIGVIILNRFVHKYRNIAGKPLNMARNVFIGMGFASVSMCIAGIIEILRQNSCPKNSEDSRLSIYTQLPQNIFIGLSQLFAMVASYEYAYFGAPRSAQSLFMSLHFCSVGISSFINIAYMNIFLGPDTDLVFACPMDKKWQWNLYTFFFILACLQLIFLIIFMICQKIFQIIKVNPEQIREVTAMVIPT